MVFTDHGDVLVGEHVDGRCAGGELVAGDAVGERYAGLWRFVQATSGASDEEVWHFFATGMLLTVDAAIDLMPRLRKKKWLQEFTSQAISK